MPVQGAGFCGGWNRLAPAVDAPYGTPRKICTAPSATPRMRPAPVATTGPGDIAEACASSARNARRFICPLPAFESLCGSRLGPGLLLGGVPRLPGGVVFGQLAFAVFPVAHLDRHFALRQQPAIVALVVTRGPQTVDGPPPHERQRVAPGALHM